MMYDLIVIGKIVLSDNILENGVILIKDEKIRGIISNNGYLPKALEVIDEKDNWIIPGGVDPHVHCGSTPGREGYDKATRSAAVGGISTIIDMPFDRPQALNSIQFLEEKINRIQSDAFVDVAVLGTLPKKGGANNISSLAKGGICGFKLSTFEVDPIRFPRITDDELYKIFPEISRTGLVVGFHAENEEIVKSNIKQFYNQGNKSILHCKSSPPICETLEILKLLEFAYEFKTKLHIYHMATPRGIRLIERFKEEGVDATAETCMHYLLLNENDMDLLKGYAKIGPPLRSIEIQEELWNMVLKGQFDFISSDHSVWIKKEKEQSNIFDCSSGVPGVETVLQLLFSEGVYKRHLDIISFTKLISTNAAKRFNLYPQKGVIAINSDADLTIIDPKIKWRISGSKNQSDAKWSPYEGIEVNGKVIRTIVRGKTIYDGKDIIAYPPAGKFVIPNK